MALLPLVAWTLLFGSFSKKSQSWRIGFLLASAFWGCVVAGSTEVLSLFNAFNFLSLSILWGAVAMGAGMLFFSSSPRCPPRSFAFLSRLQQTFAVGVVSILGLTGILSLVAAPNNWDSMVYHMSRVMHWIQNGSVAHYPTPQLKQLDMPPWAEFAIAHLAILSGSDDLANGVQWFSMVGSVVGVTLIAQELGASGKGQMFAAMAACTIPMGILESTSTQNDWVVSFWLVCFVYFGLRAFHRSSRSFLLSGISLGLGVLTKGTAYVYGPPFLIFLAGVDVKRNGWPALRKYALIPVVVVGLNAGFYGRNWSLFGNPLASNLRRSGNARHDWKTVASNTARNVALQLASPFERWNQAVDAACRKFHNVLNLDINDRATTFGPAFSLSVGYVHEDSAGNPLHFAFIVAAILSIALSRRLRHRPFLLAYGAAACGSFLLLGALIRWDPWESRYMLPFVILSIPLVALTVAERERPFVVASIATLLTIAAIPCVLFNASRPLVTPPRPLALGRHLRSVFETPRDEQYFNNAPQFRQSYVQAARLIRASNARNVAIENQILDGWEYPLWILTRDKDFHGPRIENLDVDNVSSAIEVRGFQPDVIVDGDENGVRARVVQSPGR